MHRPSLLSTLHSCVHKLMEHVCLQAQGWEQLVLTLRRNGVSKEYKVQVWPHRTDGECHRVDGISLVPLVPCVRGGMCVCVCVCALLEIVGARLELL